MATPLSIIRLVFKPNTISPAVDSPAMALNFQCTAGPVALTDVTNLMTAVRAMIATPAPGATFALTHYYGRTIDRTTNSGVVDAYDISNALAHGVPMGSPVLVGSWTPAAAGATDTGPEGVCAVVTLQAPYGTDEEFISNTRPRARDRGRIYFGPIGSMSYAPNGTDAHTQLTPAIMTDLTKAFQQLATTFVATSLAWGLVQWSRKNALVKSIHQIWMDDRPDYQRRRTDPGTTRVTAPGPA
jgi:hypothetical protein